MNAIVLYFSYTGHTRKIAEKLAHTQGAELVEIHTKGRLGKLNAFLVQCPRAMMRKTAPIQPITQDLNNYDMITLAGPVWAAYPAPVFNAMIKLLPAGKNVQLLLVSGGGSGATKKSEDGTKKLVKKQGCTVLAYKELKG
jgi:hypothetical protein